MTDTPTPTFKPKGGSRPGAGRPFKLNFRPGDILILETQVHCGEQHKAVTVTSVEDDGDELQMLAANGDTFRLRYPQPGELVYAGEKHD